MAHIDRFLSALTANRARALHLSSDELAQLDVAGAPRPITKQPFSTAQLTMLLKEIAPASAMAELESRGEAGFSYRSGDATFAARTSLASGKLAIVLTPDGAPAVAPGSGAAMPAPQASVSTAVGPAGSDPAAREQIERLLRKLVEHGASDLHLRVDEPPILRTHGEMHRLDGTEALNNGQLEAMLRSIMPERNRAEFTELNDTDFAHEIEGCARFRCNALRERKGAAAVFRVIPATIVTADELAISEEVQRLCYLTKGLVLVTGPTGSGKSTTLCALIDLVNRVRSDHVITIEDPIEFVHPNKSCIITQRQVGLHTSSFKHALRAALREDPDIILVGELRDLETVSIAIETAETGHLVFGTLHTTTAASTIDRLIDQFPADRQDQIRVMLSESLKGVISQTLCKKIGGGRVAAREILLSVPAIANLIREGKTFQIPSIIQTSKRLGMVTLNDALIDLVDRNLVEPKEAYYKATDKQGFAGLLKQRGHDASFLEEDLTAAAGKATPAPPAAQRAAKEPPAAGSRGGGGKLLGARG